MFILLLQTIWLFISELAGKDLDFSVIMKFLMFATPRLIPMVLPLTILLTSIMIFGNFAENYEFAAMKSSGISLQRAMRTLSIFIFFVGIGAFLFSNTVIPESEKRFINLRKNIVKVKPAAVITPNQFNDLGDINIKVSEKYGNNDELLKDVIIHQKEARAGNFTVIKAVDGELKGSVDSDFVTLVLNDGYHYKEVQQKSSKSRKKHPFMKTHFKKYILNMDLSKLDNVDMDAQQYSKGYNMLNVNELVDQIDTLSIQVNNTVTSTVDEINRRGGFTNLNRNLKIDTLQKEKKDTLDIIKDLFTVKEKVQIYSLAQSTTDALVRKLQSTDKTLTTRKRGLNKYEMSLHDKYALGIACILLFFVGAPLGAIIRKGGLGLPIVIGVFLFLTYHFIGIFAKNGAEEGGIPPFVGSWLSTFIIFPLSIFLTYRATTDQGFFSMDNLIQPIRDYFNKKKSKKVLIKEKGEVVSIKESISNVNIESEVYSLLSKYDNNKLEDISRNYKQYGYNEEYKIVSLKILSDRGISIEELQLLGKLDNAAYNEANECYKNFNEYSIVAIALIIISLIINIVVKIVSRNPSLEIEVMLIVFNIMTNISYFVMFIMAFVNHNKLYKLLGEKTEKPSIVVFLLLGLPFYILGYFYYRNILKKDINKIR